MILRLALCIPEDIGFIRTTRLISITLLQDIKVIREDIDAVELIVTELCSNVVRHAHSKPAKYDVVLEYYESSVVIRVSDKGDGFHLRDVEAPGTERPDIDGGTRYGGFGLPLMQALSDKLEFSVTYPHGTTVRVEKSLHYETDADREEAGARNIGSGGTVEITRDPDLHVTPTHLSEGNAVLPVE